MSASKRTDPYQPRARELAVAAGLDPDARVERVRQRSIPTWCQFRNAARAEHAAREIAAVALPQRSNRDAPLTIFGVHEDNTIAQMKNCMSFGNVVAWVLCADGHLGYAQPVGGVIAYDKQISISGVGFDIACGNMAVRLDVPYASIVNVSMLAKEIASTISFGIGRTNDERVDHPLFEDREAWRTSDMEAYRPKAIAQLGTVGSGNHYVDLLYDEDGWTWIGVHFGSRGLGHTSATKYLKSAGGKDGINVPPAVVDEQSDIGQRYLAAMTLAGRYAYAGREWVVERVRKMIGGNVTASVHNHHNYAWQENGLWVVRKGATPASPGQKGFVGGSMGDDCVILEGTDGVEARASLYSTVHGAGRQFGRKEAKRRFTRTEMDAWLQTREVTLIGADLDESPMAYRRLPDVLSAHAGSIKVLHTLRPFIVVMAGNGEFDPFRD